MELVASLIAAALLLWGSLGADTAALDIHAVYEDPPSVPGVAWSVHTLDGPRICTITVTASFWDYGPEAQQSIVEHEVGHCLGLHHADSGIMYPRVQSPPAHPVAADLVPLRHVAAVLPMLAH